MVLKYTNQLQGKRIVVVGGTSGIGFCVAEGAVEHGATVIVASSTQAKIDKTIERIKTAYPDAADRILGKTCNLNADDETVEANVKALYEFATNGKKDRLDHIVDTAGDSINPHDFSLMKATGSVISQAMKVRFFGPIAMARNAKEYMNSSSSSSFTMTSGVNGHRPQPEWAVGASMGGAKEYLVRGLAVDMAPVRVNCVAPGAVMTELFDNIGDAAMKEMLIKKYTDASLLKKISTPESAAQAYLYFMKDNFVTGQTILVDGGHVLSGA